MIDAAHISPDESGPCSNPVLFGVALALAELFPLEVAPVLANPVCSHEAATPANDSQSEDTTPIAA